MPMSCPNNLKVERRYRKTDRRRDAEFQTLKSLAELRRLDCLQLLGICTRLEGRLLTEEAVRVSVIRRTLSKESAS